jgi:Flp pilus assembly pilin Flp
MVSRWRQVLTDESGTVDAVTYILMTTLIGIGMVCGLTTFRDQLTNVLGDHALAMNQIDQSYTVSITLAQLSGPPVELNYGYIQPPPFLVNNPGEAPYGIEICGPGTGETSEE